MKTFKNKIKTILFLAVSSLLIGSLVLSGCGSNSKSSTSSKPNPPQNLTASSSNRQVSLTWNASSGAASYRVYESTTSGGPYSAVGTTTTTGYTVTGLTNGTPYYFVVTAVNSAGESGDSNQAIATPTSAPTPPAPPNGLTASSSNRQVSLTWNASSGAASYRVYESTTSGGPYSAVGTTTTTGYTVTDLTNGTPYYFVVTAVNSIGESAYSTEATATPFTGIPPSPPSGVTANAGNGQITISWNSVSGATSYNIYWSTSSGVTPANGTKIPDAASPFTQTGLTNNTTYYYIVTAVNSYGESIASGQVSATPWDSNDISGTVMYSGLKKGRIYINVDNAGGGSTIYGTSISQTGSFTIRGVPSGSYVLSAWLDNIGTGTLHASNPTGTSTPFSVNFSNVSGVSVPLSDPGTITLSSPSLIVYPGSGTALTLWNALTNSNGIEAADSYNVYWSTSNTPCSTTGGGFTSVVANSMGAFLQTGLTNGNTYYYSVRGVAGGTGGPCSSTFPVTVAANTGAYSVSGIITSNITLTGPLYVAIGTLGSNGPPEFYGLESIDSPSMTQAYNIAGITNGTYYVYVIDDMNNDGSIDIGDITEGITGNAQQVTVNNADVTQNIALTGANALASVTTQHYTATTYKGYNLGSNIHGEMKLPVAVTLTAGPNVAVPVDIGNPGTNGNNGSFLGSFTLPTNVPKIGDTYSFAVTYTDTTTENLNASVTGVLDSFPTPTFPTSSDNGDGITQPTFTWNAPLSFPSPYTYYLWIGSGTSGMIWYDTPSNGSTSDLYNSNHSASQTSLTLGTTYMWLIGVRDSYGNSAQYQTQWTP